MTKAELIALVESGISEDGPRYIHPTDLLRVIAGLSAIVEEAVRISSQNLEGAVQAQANQPKYGRGVDPVYGYSL